MGSTPPLVVRFQGSDRSLRAGPSYLVGRDPECHIVIPDARVSWRHAVLRLEDGRWVLADNGSTNGTFAGDRRVDRIEIIGECQVRLGHPADGPVLSCSVSAPARPRQPGPPPAWMSARRTGTARPPPGSPCRGRSRSRRPASRARCGRCRARRCASAGRWIATSWSPIRRLPPPRRAAQRGGRVPHRGPGQQ